VATKKRSSTDDTPNLDSPFLTEELFAGEAEEELHQRALTLASQSAFQTAFEQVPGPIGSPEEFEDAWVDEEADDYEGDLDLLHHGVSEFPVEPTEQELAALEVRGDREAGQDEKPVIFQQDIPKTSTQVVVVGQRIELDLNNTAFAGNIDKVIKWTIPGKVVRSYDGTARDAKLFELTDADLGRPKISFFWVDDADGRVVRARFRLKSPDALAQVVFVFDVKGPRMNHFTAKTDVTRIEKRAGLTGMRFGKLIEAPGIKWNWKITMPSSHAGYIKDVQTVLNDRSKILFLKPGGKDTRMLVWRHPSKTDPHVQLDGHQDGQAAYTAGLYEPRIGAGESFTNAGTSDSPHTELPPLAKTVSVNDKFTYFIMFKPATSNPDDAIWVPVAKAKWFWKATAMQRDKKWVLSQPKPKMEASIEMATVDFPMYETNASENEWQQVSP
jgi:hypothetical protein